MGSSWWPPAEVPGEPLGALPSDEGPDMPENDQVTLGEVVRRLDGVANQIVRLAEEIRQDRTLMAQTYVARETYQANRDTDDLRFKAIEGRDQAQDAFRRQVLAGLTLLFVSTVFAIVMALSGLK